MVPVYKMDTTQPVVGSNWLGTVQDGLDFGLNTWLKIEQMNAMKDASGAGRKAMDDTVQVESPQVVEVVQVPQPNQDLVQQALSGLKIGTGSMLAVFGGIAFLWWLSKR
ncbi:hypothetical protein BEL05_04905 [Shewanella colwelliana]|uniref:Uncharacterized protein n=1 Tax=Shewanella colwelliana TaxID=23 RepID=A0A1E5IQJ1_SHECO|nr:hypothetical protein [Shewanella colwelliana]OEG72318.1 hypothetical protein BEL05_04905 [Shewanella colwelliana]